MLAVSNVTPTLLPACHSRWYGRAAGPKRNQWSDTSAALASRSLLGTDRCQTDLGGAI